MRVAVVSDTHIRRGGQRRMSDEAYEQLRTADAILHAGDVTVGEVLDELSRLAPVHAVLGNNDHELVGALPETRLVELAGVRIGMVHDSGPRAGRPARMRRLFPDADVVVFGHSHEPVCEEGVEGQLLVNPGSPTERRRAPHHTMAVLDLDSGKVRSAHIVVV